MVNVNQEAKLSRIDFSQNSCFMLSDKAIETNDICDLVEILTVG